MKNLKQNIILCVGIILTGLIAACSNPYDETANETAKPNAGTGNVLIRIADGNERTILPAAVNFSRYELEVAAKTGDKPTVPKDLSGITGNGVNITLPAGEYTVTVKAYRSSGKNEYLVAQGSKTVTVISDSNNTVVIDLKPFIGEGKGFFSYKITLPDGASTATLKLVAVNGIYDKEFNLLDNSASSDPIELSAGYYELYISLKKGAITGGEYAVVHIYSGMETAAVLDLSNAFALINIETLTIAIENAEDLLASMAISDDGTDVLEGLQWVTQDAADALNEALEAAQAVVDNPPTKQRPVNEAWQALEEALAIFEAGIKDGTKNPEALIKAIKDAENELAKLDAGEIKISANGTDVSIGLQWVTQTAADSLKTALTAAQNVAADSSAKQSAVEAARQALEAALAAFAPKYGTVFANQSWTTTITPVAATPHITTPITLNITSATVWTLAIPFADINLTSGTGANAQSYSKNNGVITFNKGTTAAPTAYATATLSPDGEELTVRFTLPASVTGRSILGGTDTFVLRKGTAAAPAADIEYLFSGIWTDPEGTPPRLAYISNEKWTFSLPFEGTEVKGTLVRYNRKAGFFKADGSFYGVGEARTEAEGITGNKLTVYAVDGSSFDVFLTPFWVPFVGTWEGGDSIDGNLYVSVPFWSIENSSGVKAQGEYFWKDNEIYFISNGKYFATGTINEAKNVITVKVTDSASVYAGLEQDFIIPVKNPNPFLGRWKGTVMLVVTGNATVTHNEYTTVATPIIGSTILGSGEGQYYWKNENGTRKAYFYSNGYLYGVATMNANGNQITMVLDEPFTYQLLGQTITISTINMTKQ
jgi:hypothetical protein